MQRGFHLLVVMTLVFTISAKAANVTVNVDYTNQRQTVGIQSGMRWLQLSRGCFHNNYSGEINSDFVS